MNFDQPTAPSNKIENEKTESEKKIEEYATRIINGANSSYVLDGLPESWVQKISEIVDGHLDVSLSDIPTQYKGMRSDALEMIWTDQNNIPLAVSGGEVARSKEINRRKQVLELLRLDEQFTLYPKKETAAEEGSFRSMGTEERKKLSGWSASYELAKIAQEQGVDLSKLSREDYAEFAIQHSLAIDDAQLRAAPWQRNEISVENIVNKNKEKAGNITKEADEEFLRFCFDMLKKAGEDNRFLSENIRVRQGTKDSNSWLFFAINNSTAENSTETFKSYVSVKDLNTLTPTRFQELMVALRDAGYNGDIKIFQDLKGQGIKLNDQIVMHGGSLKDAELALQIAKNFFGEDIEHSSMGKDEVINDVNNSYSQMLAKKIASSINQA